ncbi:MAG: Fic family protein [Gammaproteobacteria bacterium]|nr:Fic family protein [Gammaproteobacteria bacterium]
MSQRAGEYIVQPGGHLAFAPATLPPNPPIVIDAELQRLLSLADRALGRLDGSIRTLPNPDLFVFMYLRKEAVLSSQIEGTQSSLNDLLEAEAEIFDAQRPRDVDEVLNYVRAMNYGLERLASLPLSTRLIREIHNELLSGVRGGNRQPGELRKIQNWIGPAGCTLKEASFVPPPPQTVEDCLSQLEIFLHDESLPALITIGLAHVQFETIHPFLDGNGRVGRLLIAFLLYQREILQTPVLYISHYFKKYRTEYYEKLQAVRDHGDWEGWLKFFLTGVQETAKEASDTAKHIVELREAHRALITEQFGRVAGNALKVLEYLYERPIINVQDIIRLTEVTYPAANNLMNKFVEHGLLAEITGHSRNRQFRYGPYIDLFG